MSDTVQNGKGDKRRPGNHEAYGEGHDRIFGKKQKATITIKDLASDETIKLKGEIIENDGPSESGRNDSWTIADPATTPMESIDTRHLRKE